MILSGGKVTFGSRLGVEEIDGSPSLSAATKVIFPNSSLTDNGDGTITVSFSGVGSFNILTATGSIDSGNTSFTFTSKPTLIVSDGAFYRENKGWTWSGSTATMTIPPNDDIYGIA